MTINKQAQRTQEKEQRTKTQPKINIKAVKNARSRNTNKSTKTNKQ